MNLSQREKIKELFDLSMRVLEETHAYVNFEISSSGFICMIYVIDNGWSETAKYDGSYCIDTEIGYFEKECKRARAHLERLLLDSGKIRKEIV